MRLKEGAGTFSERYPDDPLHEVRSHPSVLDQLCRRKPCVHVLATRHCSRPGESVFFRPGRRGQYRFTVGARTGPFGSGARGFPTRKSRPRP